MPTLSSILVWSGADNPIPSGLLWVILGAVVVVALISYVAVRTAKPPSSTDENFWKAGIFYVNPSDPALFVPKRFGIGYTVNFGNRWSLLLITILLVLILGPFVFTALTLSSIRQHLSSR